MKVALYTRVSTTRQQQAQTIEQQLERLQAHVAAQGWQLAAEHIFRDEGYSGTRLNRPGLDQLRDRAAMAEFECVLMTAPDRLARNYVHQMVILEEWEGYGCAVEFLDRPMSDDPHDQLVLQIRGAVAEYEQTLIAERMRRGRLRRLQAGQMLPWTRAPYGYILDAERPRDATRIQINEVEATVVRQLFAWYADPTTHTTLYVLAKRLTDQGIPTPRGGARWNVASIRGMLTNPAYTGTAYSHRRRPKPAHKRKSALQPVGPGASSEKAPPEEWIPIPVPALIGQDLFDQVQARLARNQQMAARNNTQNLYLLRGLVSCRQCRLSCCGRTLHKAYRYYVCRGKQDALRAAQGQRCRARYAPAQQLDTLVWDDLCQILAHPEMITQALERAQTGAWLPQEMQARQHTLQQAVQTLIHQEERLLEAYLAEVIALPELERKRAELSQKKKALHQQQRQLEAQAQKHIEIASIAGSINDFCQQIQAGLDQATFAQRRQLIELLVDCVIINDDQVEIRYVIPISEEGTKTRFCHLRTDYFYLETRFVIPVDRQRIQVGIGGKKEGIALLGRVPHIQHDDHAHRAFERDVIEHQGIDFKAVLVGHIVEATQILPVDLAVVGFLSARAFLAFGTGVEVAHVGIRAQFADGMQAERIDAVDPLLLGKVAIDDHMLFGRQQMGVDLAQVLEIGIDQRFVLRCGRADLLFGGFSGLFFGFFFWRADQARGRRGLGLPGG